MEKKFYEINKGCAIAWSYEDAAEYLLFICDEDAPCDESVHSANVGERQLCESYLVTAGTRENAVELVSNVNPFSVGKYHPVILQSLRTGRAVCKPAFVVCGGLRWLRNVSVEPPVGYSYEDAQNALYVATVNPSEYRSLI